MELISNYAFNASAKTITFTDKVAITKEQIGVIYNVTLGVEIYNFSKPNTSKGGSVAGNVLTFNAPNTSMNNTDKLAIYYKEGISQFISGSVLNSTIGNLLLPATDVSEYTSVVIHILTIGSGSPVFTLEASGDNVNWLSVSIQGVASTSGGISVFSVANQMFAGPINWRYMRIRVTTAGSGGANATAAIMLRNIPIQASPISTMTANQGGSWTGVGVNITPSTLVGFASFHKAVSAASTNATSVKASAGTVGMIQVTNTSGSLLFLKLYNKASAPTVGTDVPVLTLAIIAGQSPFIPVPSAGIRFTAGIAYAFTTGVADNDTGAVGAGDLHINISYV